MAGTQPIENETFMRQSQQKNRMRGRGRKGPNPLSRSYESNGPDVKIRGTAAHIAEKYASLARDALTTGDHVMAENYLQHAEHYNRIIAVATAQNSRNEENAATNFGRGPQPEFGATQDGEDNNGESAGEGRPESPQPGVQPQNRDENQREADRAEAGEPRPRAESRPRRRPRREESAETPPAEKVAVEKVSVEKANGTNGSGAHAGEEGVAARPDISTDAQMLPESILGAGAPTPEAGAED